MAVNLSVNQGRSGRSGRSRKVQIVWQCFGMFLFLFVYFFMFRQHGQHGPASCGMVGHTWSTLVKYCQRGPMVDQTWTIPNIYRMFVHFWPCFGICFRNLALAASGTFFFVAFRPFVLWPFGLSAFRGLSVHRDFVAFLWPSVPSVGLWVARLCGPSVGLLWPGQIICIPLAGSKSFKLST